MAEFDPGEYEIAELGPALREIEDADELEEILAREEEGEDRENVKTLIESRIEKLREEAAVDEEIDPTELTVAELGNAIRGIDDPERLGELIAAEEEGEDRKSAKSLIQKRIDAVTESEEDEEPEERLSPEEKHPDLDHPTEDKQYVKALSGGDYRDMWVYCETQHGELIDVSREMLGKARELMDEYNEDYGEDEKVVAVLIGDDMEGLTDEVIAYGADYVVVHEDPRLERFLHKPYTEVFCDMARWGARPLEGKEARRPSGANVTASSTTNPGTWSSRRRTTVATSRRRSRPNSTAGWRATVRTSTSPRRRSATRRRPGRRARNASSSASST